MAEPIARGERVRRAPRVRSAASAPAPFPWWAAGLFAFEFAVLAWSPHDRTTWLLENLLSIPFALWLVLARDRLRLSRPTLIVAFAFLMLHEVGSHYTYSLVPYGRWLPALEGTRNHYDRFVHLSFGLMITPVVWELLGRPLRNRRWLQAALTTAVMLACSTFYELMEWATAIAWDPVIGIAFVGAQGDIWDAQKDTSLALLGTYGAVGAKWLWGRYASGTATFPPSDGVGRSR